MKIATVFKHGPLELKRVLQAHSHTIGASYAAVRAHIEAFINAGREFTSAGISAKDSGPQPIEVGALGGGGRKAQRKVKGSDKGKGKGKVLAGGKVLGKDKDSNYNYKGKGGKQTGKGGQFQGHCSCCGKWGHKRMDSWKKQVTRSVAEGAREPKANLNQEERQKEEQQQRLLRIFFAVNAGISADGFGSILIDPGSDAHVVPRFFFQHWGVKPTVMDKERAVLRTIDGSKNPDRCHSNRFDQSSR